MCTSVPESDTSQDRVLPKVTEINTGEKEFKSVPGILSSTSSPGNSTCKESVLFWRCNSRGGMFAGRA